MSSPRNELNERSTSIKKNEGQKKKKNLYQIFTYKFTNTILLIAQQIGSRFLTFIANQILLRYLSPDLLGISMQLELYILTILFFSRESLRITIQRQHIESSITHQSQYKLITNNNVNINSNNNDENKIKNKNFEMKKLFDIQTASGQIQAIINLTYISLALGIGISFFLAWLFLGSLHTRDLAIIEMPNLRISLILFGCASILELLAEPCYVVVQLKSRHYIRVASESTATVFRCLTTCISAIYASENHLEIGVLPFALGQLAYSISLLVVYYLKVIQISSNEEFSLLPRPIYSPLVARLILQPIEEMSRNYFGKLLSAADNNSTKVIIKVRKSLFQLFYSYLIFSIFVVSLGPTAAPFVLKIIVGPRWSETGAGKVLAFYCYYIPLLAINGLAEAFVSSAATESEIHHQTAWMFVFSIAFSGAAFLFLKVYQIGALGIVVANSINMIFRITWAIFFIKSYLWRWQVNMKLESLIPRPITIAAGIAVSAILPQLEIDDHSLFSLFKIVAAAAGLFVFM
ncbi:putative oligosaccharide translocation protein rft1 [Erysiphe necator]|uniref:Man(5)GlcNAc(2)-PP-dolichol translocation protein RFT1 n=1 Tax=Uncinula necator TaxID=52586 RepID=A0A0B1P8X9_UNCNE|nr:putative oligosaccharide translocation protein rft1 [Erysiphe necator]